MVKLICKQCKKEYNRHQRGSMFCSRKCYSDNKKIPNKTKKIKLKKGEIFKPVKGFEDGYEISNLGRVWSNYTNKIIKTSIEPRGWIRTFLKDKNGNKINKRIHRLVATTFIPNPLNKETVNHKNGIKSDNILKNLEWATNLENIKHGWKTGLIKGLSGEKNGRNKLKKKQVLFIRKSNLKNSELAKIFNVNPTTISYIRKRKIWKKI